MEVVLRISWINKQGYNEVVGDENPFSVLKKVVKDDKTRGRTQKKKDVVVEHKLSHISQNPLESIGLILPPISIRSFDILPSVQSSNYGTPIFSLPSISSNSYQLRQNLSVPFGLFTSMYQMPRPSDQQRIQSMNIESNLSHTLSQNRITFMQ